MANILPVPHYQQKADGYCLPASAQMVLAYLGLSYSQEELGRRLGLRPQLGVPTFNIVKLSSAKLAVTYEAGTLADIDNWLAQKIPVIVFVQAGELPHWHGHLFQHALVVVGLDDQHIHLLDPAVEVAPISTPIGDFMLGWDEMDNLYATLTRR